MDMNLEPTEDWREIKRIAPHFCESLELLSEISFPSPDPLDLPECLGLIPHSEFQDTEDWNRYLREENSNGISNRELYLRVLLVYAVSDQGAHIPGVRHFMRSFIQSSYDLGIRFFHEADSIGDPRLVDLAEEASEKAKNEYSEEWAEGRSKSANSYSVFMVDGIGRLSTNSYVNSRISPALWLPHMVGGLDKNLRQIPSRGRLKHFIKSDNYHGLKNAIGDKALDLYAKWVFHSFRLYLSGISLSSNTISPRKIAIPMDQRIGRVLMRCGFMDELFGMDWCFENQQESYPMFSEGNNITTLEDGKPPQRKVHLRVTNFRSQGRINNAEIIEIFERRKRPYFSRNTLSADIEY